MYFSFSLMLATLAVVLAYFILLSSSKTEGAVKRLGQILAVWVFVLSAALPMAGGYATYADLPSIATMMRSMHSGGHS
jgi:hypothetical protein